MRLEDRLQVFEEVGQLRIEIPAKNQSAFWIYSGLLVASLLTFSFLKAGISVIHLPLILTLILVFVVVALTIKMVTEVWWSRYGLETITIGNGRFLYERRGWMFDKATTESAVDSVTIRRRALPIGESLHATALEVKVGKRKIGIGRDLSSKETETLLSLLKRALHRT